MSEDIVTLSEEERIEKQADAERAEVHSYTQEMRRKIVDQLITKIEHDPEAAITINAALNGMDKAELDRKKIFQAERKIQQAKETSEQISGAIIDYASVALKGIELRRRDQLRNLDKDSTIPTMDEQELAGIEPNPVSSMHKEYVPSDFTKVEYEFILSGNDPHRYIDAEGKIRNRKQDEQANETSET